MEIESGLHLPSFSFLYPRSCFGSSFSLPAVRIDGVSLYSQTLSTNEIHISFGCPRWTWMRRHESFSRRRTAIATAGTAVKSQVETLADMPCVDIHRVICVVSVLSGPQSSS